MNTELNSELLQTELMRDEGWRARIYKCSAGKLTIGYGRNIEAVGINEAEAIMLLDTDTRKMNKGSGEKSRPLCKPFLRFTRNKDGDILIGYGRNLTKNGISQAEGRVFLRNDIDRAIGAVDHSLMGWRETLSNDAQRAIVNMGFNLGLFRLADFKRMVAALQRGDMEEAAIEALDSKWALQVGARAKRIVKLFRSSISGEK